MNNKINILPVWVGGGRRKPRNAVNGVGHRNPLRAFIYLKHSHYEHKKRSSSRKDRNY